MSRAVVAAWGVQAGLTAGLLFAARTSNAPDNIVWCPVIISHLVFLSLLVISETRLGNSMSRPRRRSLWAWIIGVAVFMLVPAAGYLVDPVKYLRLVYQLALGSVVASSVAGILRFTRSYYRKRVRRTWAGHPRESVPSVCSVSVPREVHYRV